MVQIRVTIVFRVTPKLMFGQKKQKFVFQQFFFFLPHRKGFSAGFAQQARREARGRERFSNYWLPAAHNI